MNFPTHISEIENRISNITPLEYGKTRNHLDGSVTYLSPYISRGVISTKQVYESIMEREIPFEECEKLIQELAWRDYWQLCWNKLKNDINTDIKQEQELVDHNQIPINLIKGQTGIVAIDQGIKEWYLTGYLHNHLRMYISSLSCNLARSHWNASARWMYYNLLDGDWGSNALSWQWVAGTNSSKKYYANQKNINQFCGTNQRNTFLDIEYADFPMLVIPKELRETVKLNLTTILPLSDSNFRIDASIPTCIYNYYNIDPYWKKNENVNRIFILEPSVFKDYPVSQKCIDFAIELSKNIVGVQIFVGEFEQLNKILGKTVYYKQHPLNQNYQGIEEERDFIFKEKEHLNSFFSFWKRCKKELKLG